MAKSLVNKKARFDYEILEEFSAGIKLHGFEVKALRTNTGASLAGAYIVSKKDRLWLKGMHITPFQAGNIGGGYDPTRTRELLVTKKELAQILPSLQQKGVTMIPLQVRIGRRITIDIALAKGKKKHDKRQTLKERDFKRKAQRIMKSHT